ncbi:MAG: PD40 domain-containing protein, partial [Candidatus Aureabacteria bacterium]|nr:PD40 domain-containing protein [Candidatus Auribacterota bacterium]
FWLRRDVAKGDSVLDGPRPKPAGRRRVPICHGRNKLGLHFFFTILLSFLSTAGNPPGYPLDKDEGCFSKKDLQLSNQNENTPESYQGVTWFRKLRGMIVWSSNRYGQHDILMIILPGFKVTRLTEHPHVDYYPRISPDGKKIVFARSQMESVSQRDNIHWDVYLLDIQSGKERLLAKNGNAPSWSGDGEKVYFQKNGGEFVEHEINTGRENLLFKSGLKPVPGNIVLGSPSYNSLTGELAVTLRGRKRMTAIYTRDKKSFRIGDGCQVTWSSDRSFLYYIDRGGKLSNGIYQYFPKDRKKTLWLDMPLPFSHEYFPKMSNDGRYLVFGASAEGHEHDTADYEIFLWKIGTKPEEIVRITHHQANDCWPDIYVYAENE